MGLLRSLYFCWKIFGIVSVGLILTGPFHLIQEIMWYDNVNLTIESYVLIDEIMLMVHWICSVCGESRFDF